ncbi:MAG: hypothetical protein KC482_04200 [Dehalococcoidia bacterium]|nr:hypothetical protein [Dehalococcoidia bacterium]MCA9844413.1 hypothetical protein [Dehalococcoidia bacterium]MCA9852785.1 hypothetical protein [Dehalococcoidia bacterium]
MADSGGTPGGSDPGGVYQHEGAAARSSELPTAAQPEAGGAATDLSRSLPGDLYCAAIVIDDRATVVALAPRCR